MDGTVFPTRMLRDQTTAYDYPTVAKRKAKMALQSGAQLILQTERPDRTLDCLGFAGIPIVNPVFIVLSCADTPQARADLDNLRREATA
jgi:hypothetical protein